jgi:hypothetical protein
MIHNDDTDGALELLKRAEGILEDRTNEGREVDRNLIVMTLFNQACCY